jgi:conjugative relaxase-like TrwC/TraI family protein
LRSIHTIKSGDQGKKDYYTKDESLKQGKDQGKDSSQGKGQKNYYSDGEAKSESEEMTQAVWFGKDAERLNLRGHGLQSDFEQIFDGYIPGTNDRIRYDKPREGHQENCIYDVVLSCKKSVSMQIHLGQDERLYKAYQECVREVAELIEHDYAQARIQVNGDRRIVQTNGIIALMIPHHTSREMDMNVHTHLAIANGTYCEDGKWRSLLDRGFSHAYYMGDYFSVRMAARVQALGYEIRETVTEEGHPSWELAGYSDEQIKVFSKRSENAKVKELVAAGVSRDDALLRTRKAKDADESLEEAQDRWGSEAQENGIEAITPLTHPVTPKLKATAEQVLESAIRHYSNRSNHFTRDQIREYAFKLNRSFTVADLDKAITVHTELIDYGKLRGVDELRGHFTTVQAVEREIHTIKAWMQGQGQAIPILEREAAAQALEAIQLKTGQRLTIIGVLASEHQHQIIHGLSGVGKTTALRQLKMLTDQQQVEVMGFAPSIDAAKKLSKELGIETHTVQSLVKSKRFELKPNQLLVIDEAGMVSAEMMDVVMQKANAAGARVLLVGDTGQNQAIEAGSPMRSLMKHGAEVHHIAEIIRQQNSIQRQAVELIAKGRGLDALSLLNEHDYINPFKDRGQRVSALAAEFLALSPDEQLNTLIVAGTNAEKDAITAEIRAGLKATGRLGQSVRVVEIQYDIPTAEEAQDISCYRVGDTVKLAMMHKGLSVRNSVLCFTVKAEKNNELVLRSTDGKVYQFNPALGILNNSVKVTQLRDRALTPEEARQIAYYRVGDYIKFSRNYKRISERDYDRNWLQKNVPYQVVGKEENELIVATAGGRRFRVNPSLMRDKQVFEGHEFDIAVGDSLRWTSSNQEKGQINGKTFKIAALDGDIATILTDDGLRQLDLSEALAVDYTLTSTSYRAQGSDRPRVFVSATNDPTSNREPFYVSISRQIKELKVWTDDYEGLKHRVAESSVQSNPLELIDYGNININQSSGTAGDSSIQDGNGVNSGTFAGEQKPSWQSTSRDGGSNQETAETSRGQERHFSPGGAIGSNGGSGYRDAEPDSSKARLSDHVDRGISGLQAIADEIVRIRLQRELAEPLARLQVRLTELRELKQLNDFKQANIVEKLQEVLTLSKVEVLSTTMEDWRSLREDNSVIPHIEAISSSDAIQLSELVENFPAQKSIEFAMEEYYQASEQVIDMKSTLKTGIPVFKVDDLPEFRNEPNEDTMPTQTVEPPRRKPQPAEQSTPPGQTAKPTKRQPSTKAAKATAAFWQPLYPARVPSNIEPHHWDEFKRSAIHPDLIALNAESVSGQEVYERLLSERLAQLGTGQYVTQPMARLMAQYEQVAEGGWWGKAGIDAKSLLNLQPGQQPQLSTWGCFKADNPRLDQGKTDRKGQDEFIKYENPLGVSRSLYLPIVPDTLANRIYKKHGIQPTAAEQRSGFWYVVRQYNLPITLTEGAKKTWASLSQGEVTIGIAGVNGIYQARDTEGKLLPNRLLNEQMAVFATPGREFRFAYDQDTKAATVRTVRRDRVRGIELLEAQGCICKVVNWKPEDGKGLDDLIANRGPLAYTQAIATAQTSDQDKRTHYRTEYNSIARQVRVNYPQATPEFLDAEVYLRTIAKAEAKDGDRFLSQGDNARSLKDPAQAQTYVDHITTHAPQIRQQYHDALAAKTAAEAQRVADRAEYLAIAQQVKTELGDIPVIQLDMEVCLRSGDTGNVDRVLAQSDRVIALSDPAQVQTYIERIKTDAPQYQQQQEELAEVNAQLARDRAEYLATVKFARRTMGDFSEDRVDLFVCLSVGIDGAEADRVLAQSDTALALNDPTLVKAYIEGVKAQIPVYHQQKQVAQTKSDRDEYEAIAQQLRPGLGKIAESRLDAHVYRAAVESAKYTPERIDAILAQSKSARAMESPDEVRDHIKSVKEMANRPKFGNHRSSQRAIAMSQQNKLNERAVEPCKWLAKNAGELNLKDGSYTWQMQGFCIHLNGDRLKVTRNQNEVVLESNQSVVNGNVSAKQIEVLQKLVDLEKEQQAKQRVQQLNQSQKRSQSRKHHRR